MCIIILSTWKILICEKCLLNIKNRHHDNIDVNSNVKKCHFAIWEKLLHI